MLPSIIIFLIVLSLLVFIHELGHFLAAKKSGIMVEEFGFGYPPKIFGIKKGETVYSLNWIPFGGFVKLLGQEAQETEGLSEKLAKRSFYYQPKRVKIIVLIAGILGNFILGIFCFMVIYAKLGIPQDLKYLKIVDIIKDSPAEKAGLQNNDQIFKVNSQIVYYLIDFIKVVEANKGKEVILSTQRGDFTLEARENPPENEGRLGILITDTERRFFPWWQMPIKSCWSGIKEALTWSLLIIQGLIITIKQLFSGIAPEVAGPVGIYQLTSAAAQQGLLELIQFVGVLSVNLAILNLLPIPALDGGHLMFTIFGGLIGSKRAKVERIFNIIGFTTLISLMILVTINDLIRIFKISNLFSLLFPFK